MLNSNAKVANQYNQDNQNNQSRETKNNAAKNRNKNSSKTKKQVFLPPVGSVISSYHNNTKYMVKVLEDNKFSYNNKIYKSLSAIANEITGTRWSGYAFFHLK
jgi:hypothetical protein